MSVRQLDSHGFEEVVRKGDLPVVVDFYADWCGPCRNLAPIIDSMSKTYEGTVVFVKVNIDDEPALADEFQIRSIPAVALFDGGTLRSRSIGVKAARALASDLGLDQYGTGGTGGASEEKRVGAIRGWWGRR
ncbi:MAG: thioredoxin [Actinomycetota bacterium]